MVLPLLHQYIGVTYIGFTYIGGTYIGDICDLIEFELFDINECPPGVKSSLRS